MPPALPETPPCPCVAMRLSTVPLVLSTSSSLVVAFDAVSTSAPSADAAVAAPASRTAAAAAVRIRSIIVVSPGGELARCRPAIARRDLSRSQPPLVVDPDDLLHESAALHTA